MNYNKFNCDLSYKNNFHNRNVFLYALSKLNLWWRL